MVAEVCLHRVECPCGTVITRHNALHLQMYELGLHLTCPNPDCGTSKLIRTVTKKELADMTKPAVLISDELRNNVTELMKDEVIVKMTHEILQFVLESKINVNEYMSDWNIISAANKEYHRRGGNNAKTIGAPAEAIKNNLLILTEKVS